MKLHHVVATLALMTCATVDVQADPIAYVVPSGVTGDQVDATSVCFAMDFNARQEVEITPLGVFDSGRNGLLAPIEVAIYDRATGLAVTPIVTFAAGSGPGSGTLVGGRRFLPIAPITLAAGFEGSVIAIIHANCTSAETDGNSFGAATGTSAFPWTTDRGGGLLSFVGSGQFSDPGGTSISFPTILDSGPANQYAAHAFAFQSVPEPSGLTLVGIAIVVLLGRTRRREIGVLDQIEV